MQYLASVVAGFAACTFLLFFPIPSSAEKQLGSLNDCKKNLPYATERFARAHFAASEQIILFAYNDVRYELMNAEYECMTNVLIIIVLSHEEERYGIFHMHYTKDGTPTIRYTSIWKPLKSRDRYAFIYAWCDFIRLAYPEETREQKCE